LLGIAERIRSAEQKRIAKEILADVSKVGSLLFCGVEFDCVVRSSWQCSVPQRRRRLPSAPSWLFYACPPTIPLAFEHSHAGGGWRSPYAGLGRGHHGAVSVRHEGHWWCWRGLSRQCHLGAANATVSNGHMPCVPPPPPLALLHALPCKRWRALHGIDPYAANCGESPARQCCFRACVSFLRLGLVSPGPPFVRYLVDVAGARGLRAPRRTGRTRCRLTCAAAASGCTIVVLNASAPTGRTTSPIARSQMWWADAPVWDRPTIPVPGRPLPGPQAPFARSRMWRADAPGWQSVGQSIPVIHVSS
jgi:hypothetical protein